MSQVAKPRCIQVIKQSVVKIIADSPQEFVDRRCRKKVKEDGLCRNHQSEN